MKTNVQGRTGILPVIIPSVASAEGRGASCGAAPSRVKLGDRLEACPTLGCAVLERRPTAEDEGRARRPRTTVHPWLWMVSFLGLALLMLAGCGERETVSQTGALSSKPIVISANYPLHSFAQRIGGEEIDTRFLVPPDIDPAEWEPTPDDIARMQQADLILLNGAGYEKWLSTISLPESKLVDTSTGFTDQYLREESSATHQHGPGGEHTHGQIAFTTWLDLSLAIQQAQAVERALAQLVPDKSASFAGNLVALTNELDSLDHELLAWGESMKGQPLITSHPVYQYFARRYGLNVKSVHWEPDEVPDAAAWRELDTMLKEHPANLMIWEREPDQASVEELQRRGLDSKVFVPCANAVDDGDFPSVMRKNVLHIRN